MKKNWLIMLYALVVPLLVSFVIDIITNVPRDEKTEITGAIALSIVVVFIVKYLISTLFNLGVFKIQLKATNGEKPKYIDLINGFDVYWKFLIVTILYSLVVLGGLILLIIPGIYFAITYMFAPFLIVDKKMSVSDAFTKSKQMTKGRVWSILLFIVLSVIFTLLGLIVLLVGVIVTAMISGLALIQLYKQLLNETPEIEEAATLNLDLEKVEESVANENSVVNTQDVEVSVDKTEVSTEKSEVEAEKPVENVNN